MTTPPPNANLQFSEEQRTEVFRREVMGQLERQTKHLDSIRTILTFFTIMFLVGALIMIILVVANAQTP